MRYKMNHILQALVRFVVAFFQVEPVYGFRLGTFQRRVYEREVYNQSR